MLARAVVEVSDSPEKAKHLYHPHVLKEQTESSHPIDGSPAHKPVYNALTAQNLPQ